MDISKTRSDKVQDAQVKDLQKSQKSKEGQNIQSGQDLSTVATPKQSIGTEKVKWSESAQLFSEGLAAAKNAPDVRADKVAQLKAAIKSGQYKVDSQAVADKMLKASLEEQEK